MSKEHEISYPPKPDARGTAKKYYDRRAYYFGKHNSPESHMLFALWKQRLIETGEPPEVRTLRVELAHLKSAPESSELSAEERESELLDVQVHPVFRRSNAMPVAIAFAAILVSVSIVGRSVMDAYQFKLSDEEKSIIRGHRMHQDNLERIKADQQDSIRHEIRQLLMDRDEPITPEFHEKIKSRTSELAKLGDYQAN